MKVEDKRDEKSEIGTEKAQIFGDSRSRYKGTRR